MRVGIPSEAKYCDEEARSIYLENIEKWKDEHGDLLCGESVELLVFDELRRAGHTIEQANSLMDKGWE